jgi:pimeloyl-ACP methyl ester carboxylesterase
MTPSPSPAPEKRTTVRANPLALRAVRAGLSAVEAGSPALAARLVERLMFRTRRFAIPLRQRKLLESGQRFTVASRHGKLAAWRWGSGPVVLLVHGWNGRGSQLGALVEPLVRRGFEVVTFDAPGHGASEGTRSSLIHFADGIDAAIDAVRQPFGSIHAVVAHSMGGAAATYAMSRFRRAPATQVERALREAELPGRRFVFVAPPVDVRDFVRSATRILGVGEETRDSVSRLVESTTGVGLDELHAPTAARTLHAPLLVLHDADDHEVPLACGQELAGAWPGARLEITHGLGHNRILWDAAVVERIAGFVAGD